MGSLAGTHASERRLAPNWLELNVENVFSQKGVEHKDPSRQRPGKAIDPGRDYGRPHRCDRNTWAFHLGNFAQSLEHGADLP